MNIPIDTEHYIVIQLDANKGEIKHKACGKTSSFSRINTIRERISKGHVLCTHCNPLRVVRNLRKDILSHKQYKHMSGKDPWHSIKHDACEKEFKIHASTLSYRIDYGLEICTNCNPVQNNVGSVSELLPIGYNINDRNGEMVNVKHAACGVAKPIHRRTLTYRLKNGYELCTHCNPLQKQYSAMELEILQHIKSVYTGDIMSEETDKFRIGMFTLDYYFPELRKGIEFYGDFYHANPIKFDDSLILKNGKNAKQIREKDKKKLLLFKKNNIDILVVWEYDWVNSRDKSTESIMGFLNII